jgi:transposase-like protein
LQRSDEDKLRIVRQVLASENQTMEIKRLGIYPNQFYDWKKRYLSSAAIVGRGATQRGAGRSAAAGGRSAADDAKAFLHGKAGLLERLRAQRAELDRLIEQLSS